MSSRKAVTDTRQAWKVANPLRQVLCLVVRGTIANRDDYEDIVEWESGHLSFLHNFAGHGIPRADWLRTLMNLLLKIQTNPASVRSQRISPAWR
jgi:hypothetical protein